MMLSSRTPIEVENQEYYFEIHPPLYAQRPLQLLFRHGTPPASHLQQ